MRRDDTFPFDDGVDPGPFGSGPLFPDLPHAIDPLITTPAPDDVFEEPPLDDLARADLEAARVRLGAALPTGGWLECFVRACLPLTNTPVEFEVVSGLAAIAATYGNRVAKWSHGGPLYPHVWPVIVAGSSYWHKSTPIRIAKRLLVRACPDALLPNSFTAEALVKALVEKPGGLATLDELGDLLASLRRDYNGNLKSLLMSLFDGGEGYERVTIGASGGKLYDVAITFLSATTLENAESLLTQADVASGFLPRFVFVTATVRSSEHEEDEEDDANAGRMNVRSQDHLVEGLARLGRVGPPFNYQRGRPAGPIEPAVVTFGREARSMFSAWRKGWEAEALAGGHMFDLSSFATRMEGYVQKFAILYRASACAFDESQDPLVVDEAAMESAIAYVRILWQSMAEILDNRIAFSTNEVLLRRALDVVGAGRSWSDALKAMKLLAKDFTPLVDTHVETGTWIVESTPGATLNARPSRFIKAGPKHPRRAEFDRLAGEARERAAAERAAARARLLEDAVRGTSLEPDAISPDDDPFSLLFDEDDSAR